MAMPLNGIAHLHLRNNQEVVVEAIGCGEQSKRASMIDLEIATNMNDTEEQARTWRAENSKIPTVKQFTMCGGRFDPSRLSSSNLNLDYVDPRSGLAMQSEG